MKSYTYGPLNDPRLSPLSSALTVSVSESLQDAPRWLGSRRGRGPGWAEVGWGGAGGSLVLCTIMWREAGTAVTPLTFLLAEAAPGDAGARRDTLLEKKVRLVQFQLWASGAGQKSRSIRQQKVLCIFQHFYFILFFFCHGDALACRA